MAQDIRRATKEGTCPEFTVESAHTRLLIEFMKSRQVPVHLWDDMVGPLAYRYFPKSNKVSVRYPPGTGLVLALFPQDRALHGLDRFVVITFLAGGLLILIVAVVRRAWLSAGLVVLALQLGLEILGKIDNSSFSINAMLAPLLLAGLCLFGAGNRKVAKKSWYLAWLLTLLAGLFFGFAILVRLPVVLLLPGLLLMLWPAKLREWRQGGLWPFTFGVAVTAVLPQAIHQSRLAGAWYLSTYTPVDTGRPRWQYFWPNLSSYFGQGRSGSESWILLIICVGIAGLLLWLRDRERVASATDVSDAESTSFLPEVGWVRLLVATGVTWGLPVAYFLTHQYVQAYYLAPSAFGSALLLGLGAMAIEVRKPVREKLQGRRASRALQLMGLALALTPGVVAIQRAWSNYERPSAERRAPRFVLPAELANEHAWIWADDMSGTLWYYARKPAHKINSTDKETRGMVYEFVNQRAEPQYLIGDDPAMKLVEKEIVELGGTLELRGEVDGRSYYLVRWPAREGS
ncbi:MAG: hypothetical protein QOD75_613 [Blastocatellia bacterium]|nr:hypothetical protein [Blastocatellia bacterium]